MVLGLHRTPRIDRRGLAAQYKLDEGRNLLKYSEDFSNSVWTKSNVTFSSSKLIENTSESMHVLSYSIYVTAGAPHTWFFDIKAGGRNWTRFAMYGSGVDEQAYFNVSSGTVGTKSSGVIAKIVDQGSGIYRCSVTFIPVASSFSIYLFIATADNVITYTGDGTSGLYIYRTQLERFPYQVTPWTLGGIGNNLLTANQSSVETDTTGFAAGMAGTVISRDTTEHYFGVASLKTITDGSLANQNSTVLSINVAPSKIYTGSVYVKGSGVILIAIAEQDSSDGYIGSSSISVTLTSVWTRYSISRLFGATGVKARIFMQTPSTNALTWYTDGLQLEQVNPTVSTYKQTTDQQSVIDSSVQRVNLLTPNQANACEDGTITGFAQNSSAALSVESTEHYYSFKSLKVVTTTSQYSGMKTSSTQTKGSTRYTASLYLKGASGGEPLTFRIDDSSGWLAEAWLTVTTEWKRFTISGTTRAGSSILFLAVMSRVAGTSCTFYMDGLQIEEGSVATPWQMPPGDGQLGSTSGVDVNDPTLTGEGFSYVTNDYIVAQNRDALNMSDKLTLITVAKFNAAGWGNFIFDKGNPEASHNGYSMRIRADNNKLQLTLGDGTTSELKHAQAINYGEYQFMAYSWDGRSFLSAINSLIVSGGIDWSGTISSTTEALYMGARASLTEFSNQFQAYGLVFNKAASRRQLIQNYYAIRHELAIKRGVYLAA